ncbi:TRAP transporter small permease subunit [Thiohalocapsa sp. ML1]|jgi:TRAP-type mannitol/chloroaromatic compound transport system permease small subunit|uniref:TRAP transporter small permease subunit n=1 Tax=Thiohalocapsa sp. ML1 TaxID=1431688 RepID=UPI0007320963|nr:TRAP transporter small permease subunit [Thiohalocapsa sp. ML1]
MAQDALIPAVLLRVASALDLVNAWVGRVIAWLALAMVLVTFLVVVLRYGFDSGSVALQESVTYMHALLFMLGAAYTLQQNGHVRVDIFYQRFSPRGRAWVDLLGTLVLLVPVSLFILLSSWDYVMTSWSIHESSREAGGLPYVYWLKSLLVAMPLLMLVQGLVLIVRNGLFLAGVEAALPSAASEAEKLPSAGNEDANGNGADG